MAFNLRGLLQDEEFLLGAGLLTAGSKGQSAGEAIFPSLIQAAKIKKSFAPEVSTTKAVFSIKDNKNVLASEKEISLDKPNYLPATKKDAISPSDLGVMVYKKLEGLTGEAFDKALKNLPQNEQDIYAKVVKPNESWIASIVKDKMKDNNGESMDLSNYSLSENGKSYGDINRLVQSVVAAPQNKGKSFNEIIEGLIEQGLIQAN